MSRLLIAVSALAGSVAFLLLPAQAAQVAAQRENATALVRSFGSAWNAHQLDAVLAAFAPRATIEDEFGCCAAQGLDQIRPFLQARFAEDHRIAWGEPQVKGDTLTFLSRILAQDGLNSGVTLTTGGGPDDPEAAPIRVVVVDDKIATLHLGLSKAAIDRAQKDREGHQAGQDQGRQPGRDQAGQPGRDQRQPPVPTDASLRHPAPRDRQPRRGGATGSRTRPGMQWRSAPRRRHARRGDPQARPSR